MPGGGCVGGAIPGGGAIPTQLHRLEMWRIVGKCVEREDEDTKKISQR